MSEKDIGSFYQLSSSSRLETAADIFTQASDPRFNIDSLKVSYQMDDYENQVRHQLLNRSRGFLSQIEQEILRSNVPIELMNEDEQEEISVNGEKGILLNKSEIAEWNGEIPLSDYQINEDPSPEIIKKRTDHEVFYKQDMAIRYLRPPTPPPPGDIYIRQENIQLPAAPPLIIRQQPARPETPPPLVIREAPPLPPPNNGKKIIYIQGKKIPPPPRKVIIERLPPMPNKPQSIIIERWLPYKPLKRKVIFQRANENDPVLVKSKNLIVQWEKPNVTVKKEFKDLGIVRADPMEYSERYGSTLKKSIDLPNFVQDIKPPSGLTLAAESASTIPYELEGDLHALNLVDLESEGLNEYRNLLRELNLDANQLFLKEKFLQHSKQVEPIHHSTSRSSLAESSDNVKHKDFLSDLFSLIDLNSSISLDEAENLLLGLYTRLGMRYGKSEANHFFSQIDFNSNGTIDLARFRNVLEKEFL